MRFPAIPALLAISVLSGQLPAAPSIAQRSATLGYGKQYDVARTAADDEFELQRIPLPDGAVGGVASFVSNSRTVAGTYFTETGKEQTFLYAKGQLETIIKPGVEITSVPSIADGGQIMFGNWGSLTEQQAGTYNRKTGTWTPLPEIPAKPINIGWTMNNTGRAIGEACRGTFEAPIDCAAWYWNGKEYEFLSFPGLAQPQIRGLNDRGQISGSHLKAAPFDFRSFIYEDQTITPLFTDRDSTANAINDQGQVLLMLELSSDQLFRPALYDSGEATLLPLYPGSLQTVWIGLNERGDLAGLYLDSFSSPPQPAVAWVTRKR